MSKIEIKPERLLEEKCFAINVDPYGCNLFFAYGDDLKSLRKKTREMIKPEYWKNVDLIFKDIKGFKGDYRGVYAEEKPVRLITIRKQKNLHDFLGILVHETLHATADILNYKGIPMNSETEEAWTYIQQHMFETLMYNMLMLEEDE